LKARTCEQLLKPSRTVNVPRTAGVRMPTISLRFIDQLNAGLLDEPG